MIFNEQGIVPPFMRYLVYIPIYQQPTGMYKYGQNMPQVSTVKY